MIVSWLRVGYISSFTTLILLVEESEIVWVLLFAVTLALVGLSCFTFVTEQSVLVGLALIFSPRCRLVTIMTLVRWSPFSVADALVARVTECVIGIGVLNSTIVTRVA